MKCPHYRDYIIDDINICDKSYTTGWLISSWKWMS